MRGPLPDKLRVEHVLHAIASVEKYLTDVTYDEFLNHEEKIFATIKQLEIIGEASNHISTSLKDMHPEVKWSKIRGFRNISIHQYFNLELEVVWQIAQKELPELENQFTEIKTAMKLAERLENKLKTENKLLPKKRIGNGKGKKL